MKKIFIFSLIVLILCGCNKESNYLTYAYSINTEESKTCNDVAKLIFTYNGVEYYYNCLDSIKVKGNTFDYTLEEALNNGISFTDVLKYLSEDGPSIYYDKNNNGYTNNGIRILVCDKKIYLGKNDFTYNTSLCNN